MLTSTPSLNEFVPLPSQLRIIKEVRKRFDYTRGVHEVLLSGSVGSSKSLLLAHLAVTHCFLNPNAHVGFGRLTLPSLKDTLMDITLKHIDGVIDYEYNSVKATIRLPGGSKITGHSWADKNYKKFRSQEFSAFFVEELTENKTEDFYKEMILRVGRLKHINEKLVVCATNPDSPEHWAYKRFIENPSDTRRTYYSKTLDNPYLPDSYISQIEETVDAKLARRMLYGEWIELNKEVIYYAYNKEHHFRNFSYPINANFPVHISFDFNIGYGKPMSAVLFQFIDGEFHFFDEAIVEGSRTEDIMEELYGRGYMDYEIVINGDASGKHKDTRNKKSDYDIIRNFLDNSKSSKGHYTKYMIDVPLSNPKVRERHNIINGLLHNAKGQRRLFLYDKCKILDEGLRLTKLKDGANYIEDDSRFYQHCTTALGYGCLATLNKAKDNFVRIYKR